MAVAIPIIASAVITGAVAGSWAVFVGALVLGGISYALSPKPPKQGGIEQTPYTSNIAIRQSDLTRIKAYGATRVTRGYAHMEATDVNDSLHQIIILCEGQLRDIGEIWMDDYAIPVDWIDADGNVIAGRYNSFLTIRKHLGEPNQVADSLAIANMPTWTNLHRLQGIAYLYVIMKKNQDVYPNGAPNVSAIVEGPSIYDPRVSGMSWSTNIALMCSDYLTSQTGYGIDNTDIDMTNVAAQANICDEIVAVTDLAKGVIVVNVGNNVLTLEGSILEFCYGDQVQVTSSGTLPGGLSALTNYYVIPYQVKDLPRVRLASSLSNAMARAEVEITSTGSGSIVVTKKGEPRYHGGGVIDSATDLSENMTNLVNSMAGRAINIGGFWTLLAGAWRSPDITLGISDMRGAMGMKNGLSMSESFNVVKGKFNGAVSYYQDTDYPPARYPQFIADDNGIEASKELPLPFTDRPTTAQRIAKIELFRGRQGISFTNDFTTAGLQVQPGDNVALDVERLGWDGKYFEITNFGFDLSDGKIITRLALRETAQAIFDWSAGEAISFDPAPNTNIPNIFNVLPAQSVSYNSRATDTRDGDVLYTLTLEWALHPDAFVREFGDYEIQYKLSASPDWLPSFFVDGSLVETDVVAASINTLYDLRIRARNNLGVRSAWTTIFEAIVGYSGGVTDDYDWGFVYESPSEFEDWGSVADAPTTIQDWGFTA